MGAGTSSGVQDALYRPSSDPTQSNLSTQTRNVQNTDRRAYYEAQTETMTNELSRLRPPDTSVRSSEMALSGLQPLLQNADAQRAKIVDSLERNIGPGLNNIGKLLEKIYDAVSGEGGKEAANNPQGPAPKSKTVTATESVVNRKRTYG